MFGYTAGQAFAFVIACGAVVLVRALASVCQKLIEENSRTRRLSMALHGSEPVDRPDIIRACSQLEGNAAGAADPGGHEPERSSGAAGRSSR